MSVTPAPAAAPLPSIGRLTVAEISVSLRRGVDDFRAAPQFGLFFSAVYVLGGFAMMWLGAGHVVWILATSLGFPLIAPFAAVGLYEVSRRLEAHEKLDWPGVLGVVWAERNRQIPWLGALIVIYFLFWTFLAHMIFALVMGPSALINVTSSIETFLTPRGLTLIAIEVLVGGILAFLLFALTVVSLPLTLDQEVDFVSAILLSLSCVRRNLGPMMLWAAIIAVCLFAGIATAFLGLVLVLPVLGHASWHIYRRALYSPT